MFQYGLLGFLFLGDKVFEAVGARPPALYLQARENKVWTAFLIFMIGNQISGSMMSTNAFEISFGTLAQRCVVNGKIVCGEFYQSQQIFSKISQQRFPDVGEVLEGIRDQIDLLKPLPK
eukprot:c10190_g1_i1.p1 GENE.c10190_g1_i1~~c10190_g1_i1.p1  ORF type:complete len:119 (+),score=40.29 c10190_g1_i1:306-662(+)